MRKAISKLSCALSAFMLMCLFMLLYTANGANTAKAATTVNFDGWTARIENGIGTLTDCTLDEETIIVSTKVGSGSNIVSGKISAIGNYCIMDKAKMVTLIISEGITDIDTYGVIKNPALTTVYLPKSLNNFDSMLFAGCDNLRYIYYGGTKQEWQDLLVKTDTDFFQPEAFVNSTVYYESDIPVGGFKATASGTSIKLSWAKNSSADGYIIEQLSSSTWKEIATISSNSTTSYTVTGLTPGTGYSFRISLFTYTNGTRVTSSTTTIKAATTTTGVTGFKVIGRAADALRLSWDKTSSIDGYLIERKSGGSWVTVKKITSPSTTEFRVEGLSSGTSYTFRIRAYNNVNGSAQYSAEATLTSCTGPGKVSGFKVIGRAADALRLSWNKTSSDGYIIERKSGSSWVTVKNITTPSTTELRVEKLSPSTGYTFRIKAYKKVDGTTLYGTTVSLTSYTNPSVMTGLKLKGRAADALRISWSKNTTADGYIIERKSGSSWVRVKKITDKNTLEYRISGLNAFTSYTFRVQAYKINGAAYYGAAKSISATTNPAAVSGFAVSSKAGDTINLKWNKQSTADGYIIEQKSGSTWKRIAKLTSNSTLKYSVYKLKANTSYSFRIEAYKMVGSTALYSSYKTLSVKTSASGVSTPNTVTGLKIKGTASNALRLGWDKNPNAQGYIIEQKSGSTWKRIAKLTSASTCEYKISSLKPSTTYSFRIKAYKTSGKNSYYSSYVSISAKTGLSTVSGFKAASNTETSIKLSWNKDSTAQGYIIEVQSLLGWNRVAKITKNTTTSYTVTGLKASTKYKIRIKSYRMSGSTAQYGSYVTISASTKVDPTAVNGFSGFSAFEIPTIPAGESGAGNTRYVTDDPSFFLGDKYSPTKPNDVWVSCMYSNRTTQYTHSIVIELNGRESIRFVLPSGQVKDGDIFTLARIHGIWGICSTGEEDFYSNETDRLETCYIKAIHVDWTGLTPSIFYFAFRNKPSTHSHEYEGVVAVKLAFNINHPPTPRCWMCWGTKKCQSCGGTGYDIGYKDHDCPYCNHGECPECKGTGLLVDPFASGPFDNVYLP